jgi:hypothetical protein
MKTRRVLLFLSTACLAGACGSRTGLLVPVHQDAGGADATSDAIEEGDASEDVAEESEPDVQDVFIPPDGPDICPDAGSTVIYVVAFNANDMMDAVLMSFYPPTATFTTIGPLNCPDPGGSPFSMAVSRQGVAYVVYTPDGNLFRVSTKTAQCGPTPFTPIPTGNPMIPFLTFGMGFAADVGDAGLSSEGGETLYLAGDTFDPNDNALPVVLRSLDTTTFQTRIIGTVNPPIILSELTGTGGGQLYGFFPLGQLDTDPPAAIGQIDKTSARLLSSVTLPSAVNIMTGWAFAFWGGDFYTFTAPDMTDTIVQRYRPSDGTVVTVATVPGLVIDGAGVSTCAPQM